MKTLFIEIFCSPKCLSRMLQFLLLYMFSAIYIILTLFLLNFSFLGNVKTVLIHSITPQN